LSAAIYQFVSISQDLLTYYISNQAGLIGSSEAVNETLASQSHDRFRSKNW